MCELGCLVRRSLLFNTKMVLCVLKQSHQEKPIYLGKYGPTIFGLLVHRKAIAGLQALTKAADITIHFQVNEMPSEWHKSHVNALHFVLMRTIVVAGVVHLCIQSSAIHVSFSIPQNTIY